MGSDAVGAQSTGRAEGARAAGYVVRDARPEDAAEIGPVHVQVWREAYAGLMPADYLAALDPQASAGRWAKTLAQPADGVRRLVGVAPTGEVVAIALRPGPAGTTTRRRRGSCGRSTSSRLTTARASPTC